MAPPPPTASIVALTQALVRLPSRGGLDPYEPVFSLLEGWLGARDVPVRRVRAEPGGDMVALACGTRPSGPGPGFILNATIDTAPFGDLSAWTHPPTAGAVQGGWLVGRGSGDSKAGVAIFCHLLADAQSDGRWAGAVTGLFDADEHTGAFGGVRACFEDSRHRAAAGVLIGYPGNDTIVIGSRGFLRATFRVSGRAAHSGSRRPVEANAVARAARLVALLDGAAPDAGDAVDAGDHPDFPVPAKVTVTSVSGGEGFSVVPDRCDVEVDVRLTPRFDAGRAEFLLRGAAAALDAEHPGPSPTAVELHPGWPAYRLADGSPLAAALQEGARRAFGRTPPFEVVGPSNAGNFLAGLGVEATAGFGVTCRNIHAVDEAILVESIAPVYEAYRTALDLLVAQAVSPG